MIKGEIKYVEPGSIAEELEIEAGDFLLKINDKIIHDIIEYGHVIYQENLVVEIMKKCDSEIWELEIEKDEYEDLGVEFSEPIFDDVKTCRNNCVFCFVAQLPGGMRKSVYIKDEDFRTSFLFGSYMTLSNMDDKEIDKIIKKHLSPLFISVHATDPVTRVKLLRNPDAGNVMEKIRKLAAGGIEMHTQAVLVPGINDGAILEKTVTELSMLYPHVRSLSVVPVGLTKYNKTGLRVFEKEESKKITEYILNAGNEFKKKHGTNFVFIADEFIIKSEAEIPPKSYYEEFEVMENGIGLTRLLIDDAKQMKKKKLKYNGKKAVIACGVSIYPYLKEIMAEYENIEVKPVVNHFFGETVTVTGLITGSDLIRSLGGNDLGDEVIIHDVMLNDDNKFLDNFTVPEVAEKLGVNVRPIGRLEEIFVEKKRKR